MKKILIIFVWALNIQVTYAQLYSTAEHEEYTRKALGLRTSLLENNITFGNTTHTHTTRTFFVQPSSYTQRTWKGELHAVGEAVSNITPVMRREGSSDWGSGNLPADPAVPLGNMSWWFFLFCTSGYALLRKHRRNA